MDLRGSQIPAAERLDGRIGEMRKAFESRRPEGPAKNQMVIGTDWDGTVRGDKGVPDATREALADAVDDDIAAVIVTARPPHLAAEIANEHLAAFTDSAGRQRPAINAVIVGSNGAFLYRSNELFHVEGFSAEQVSEIIYIARLEYGPRARFAFEKATPGKFDPSVPAAYREDEYLHPEKYDGHIPVRRDELLSYADGPGKVIKVQVALAGEDANKMRLAAGKLNDVATVTNSFATGMVEVGPRGFDKGTGFAKGAAACGRDLRWSVFFGDMPNDIPGFRAARVAYALANANEALLAEAGLMTMHDVNAAGQSYIVRGLVDGTLTFHPEYPGVMISTAKGLSQRDLRLLQAERLPERVPMS